jgi:hydroxypyruvate reductase
MSATVRTAQTPPIALVGSLAPGFADAIGALWPLRAVASQDELAAIPAAIRARITVAIVAARFDDAALAALPGLRFALNAGIGHEKIDLPALRRRGVAAANLAGVAADCVAEMAMALLLDVARGTSRGDRFVRHGRWGRDAFPFVHRLGGKRLGIVGLGSIGRAIARRAAAFGMRVAYHGRRRQPDQPYDYAASMLDLARASDHLAIAAPGGEETRHLVDAAVLAALPSHGIVVNVGRGSVIDQDALIAALATGRLFGAGLDVIDGEPAVPAALLALENVVVTPHRAGSTLESLDDALRRMIETLRAWELDGTNLAPI